LASRFLAAAACSLLITEAAALSQRPVTARLEDRLRDYIERFEQEAAALVAEERYEQRLTRRLGSSETHTTRTLLSDFILVRPSEAGPWLGFRDVYEVDGEPVRERNTRLLDTLASTAPDSLARAQALTLEAARFNVGPRRTVNAPTMPMQLLDRLHRDRIRVRGGGVDPATGTAVLRFEERDRPTIVRTPEGGDVFTRGEVTIRLSDAAILSATLRYRFPRSPVRQEAVTVIDYAGVEGVTVPVPRTMRETIPMADGSLATGEATYTNYRRFQTSVRIR
jgi:hypothetical protein